MPRKMLTDEHGSKLKKIMLEEGIYDKPNLRLMIEGMLYRMRVGCPWRDLPRQFGRWNSVYKKFNAWSATGKWRSLFRKLALESDVEWEFMDGSYVKAHQHSAGAATVEPQGIGKVAQAIRPRYTLLLMPMGYRLILSSPAAKRLIAQSPRR